MPIASQNPCSIGSIRRSCNRLSSAAVVVAVVVVVVVDDDIEEYATLVPIVPLV